MKKLLSITTALALVITSLFTFAITTSAESTEEHSYYLVGDSGLCNNAEWIKNAEVNKLSKNQDGNYEITVNGVNPRYDEKGNIIDYGFRICTDGEWEPAFGYGGELVPGEASSFLCITEENSQVRFVLEDKNEHYVKNVTVYINGKEFRNNTAYLVVKNLPDKLQYEVGETFDRRGMVVEFIDKDGTAEEINNYCVNYGFFKEPGKRVVEIKYSGFIYRELCTKLYVDVVPATTKPTTPTEPYTPKENDCKINFVGCNNLQFSNPAQYVEKGSHYTTTVTAKNWDNPSSISLVGIMGKDFVKIERTDALHCTIDIPEVTDDIYIGGKLNQYELYYMDGDTSYVGYVRDFTNVVSTSTEPISKEFYHCEWISPAEGYRITSIHAYTQNGENADIYLYEKDGVYELAGNYLPSLKIVAVAEPIPTTEPTTKPVAKTTVTLAKSSSSLYVKGTTAIKATVKNGKGATTYKSNNTKVAKVDSKGKVTALKAGTAKITVKNNKVSKVFTVKVVNPKLNKTSVSLKKGKSVTLKITGKIGKATFKTSNKKIATVNGSGKIVAKKKGSATITVKTNGVTLKCKVKVK